MQRGYSSSRDGLYRDSLPIRGPFLPGGYSLAWPLWGSAAGQGMVFYLSVRNRVYNFLACLTQTGYIIFCESVPFINRMKFVCTPTKQN